MMESALESPHGCMQQTRSQQWQKGNSAVLWKKIPCGKHSSMYNLHLFLFGWFIVFVFVFLLDVNEEN